MISIKSYNPDASLASPKVDCFPTVIYGIKEINTLSPVSKLTGKRTNLLTLLGVVSNKTTSDRIAALLQELPVIKSDPKMTDDDRINFCVERLSSGTPSEDDAIRKELEKISDVLLYNPVKDEKVEKNDTIKFDSAPDVSNESV